MSDTLTAPVTAATLAAFSDAFNRHDANALMGFMTEDCVF
ncbi:MAG: nuclear transport factor 2 family protein, partial [Burkholderia sp.]|nr:nuclear transport factor 2 family protein [Burkholderia sp.]